MNSVPHAPDQQDGPQQVDEHAEGLPVAPLLGEMLQADQAPRRGRLLSRRVVLISGLAMVLAVVSAFIAQALTALIGLVTNLAYYGRWSYAFVAPSDHVLGVWAIGVPVVGGVIVGLMARWGSQAIRGHGIPEAMEQILMNDSKIAPRITLLKPLSSAIAIGTGGPFGAEGPIIATGGALGSVIGQLLRVTAVERKTLLAAGAAAGMAATFGTPLAATVLAVELLLFELRPRSLIPVALAAACAAAVRTATLGSAPVFPMPTMAAASSSALVLYALLGCIVGLLSISVTRSVYAIEDWFERLPIHWMWWPALGGLAVGIIGYFAPLTLGVGYSNIQGTLNGQFTMSVLLGLCVMKFLSWSIALGSGTSGGTLAPLFTIGGTIGALLSMWALHWAPFLNIDPRMAALVGMAAIFTGASRAFLASVVFALETTHQPMTLLPLLAGCTMAYLLSGLRMRNTIMTEKIARRGIRVPSEYEADHLDQLHVGESCSTPVVSLQASHSVGSVRAWLAHGTEDASHQGFPVVDESGRVLGVLTRRDLLAPNADLQAPVLALVQRAPIVVYPEHTLREAADHMVSADVGRLIVVERAAPHRMLGILTRSDLLRAHHQRLQANRQRTRHIKPEQWGVKPASGEAE